MHISPLADDIPAFVANLFPTLPTPEPPRSEPPFTPLRAVVSRLTPSPGEVIVVAGMPDVRMLTAAIVLAAAEENQVVAIDKLTYAGPSLQTLVMALSGVSVPRDPGCADRVLGAVEALSQTRVLQVSNGGWEDRLTGFPAGVGLMVVEAERFASGFAGIAREAARTDTAAVVPHDHADDLPAGSWRVVRLHRAGVAYASGHHHMIASFDGSGETVRLAQGAVGRFL